jgi:ectoine hydrolase
MGYSMGIGYPPDWGERTMSVRPGDPTLLSTNTTFHLMPGIWADDWGVEISKPILVTETGCERLAEVSQALIIK